jgi:hypothetical protein
VPQFQQLYHPVLIAIAAGLALVLVRLVLGPGRTLLVVGLAFLIEGFDTVQAAADTDGHAITRSAALYFASAAAVELAALVVGTANKTRFAVAAGTAVATLGLAGEWVYNSGAHQPWTSALLPDALLVGALAAIGAAVVGAAIAGVVTGERVAARVAVAGALAVVIALALPFPRRVGDVTAALDVEPAGQGRVRVTVTLDPSDAATDARWFQTMAWQGGGSVIAAMDEVAPGRYVADRAVPADERWKVMVRLHRGAEMMAVPVRLPADAEYDAPALPAEDRVAAFEGEGQYLMREHSFERGLFAYAIYVVLAGVGVLWVGTYVIAALRLPPRGRQGEGEEDRGEREDDVDPVDPRAPRDDGNSFAEARPEPRGGIVTG